VREPKQPPVPITPSAPTPAPTPAKLTHDEFMAKLAANPRFKLVRGSGQGFIIGGQKPHKCTSGGEKGVSGRLMRLAP
jgi:hypothetical protein